MKFSKLFFSSLLAVLLVIAPSADMFAVWPLPVSARTAWWTTATLSVIGVWMGFLEMSHVYVSRRCEDGVSLKTLFSEKPYAGNRLDALKDNVIHLNPNFIQGLAYAVAVPALAKLIPYYFPYDLTLESTFISAHTKIALMMQNQLCTQPFSGNNAGLMALVTERYEQVSVSTLIQAQASLAFCASELSALIKNVECLQAKVAGNAILEQESVEMLSVARKMLGNSMINSDLLTGLIKNS